jgi:hypothetical protein
VSSIKCLPHECTVPFTYPNLILRVSLQSKTRHDPLKIVMVELLPKDQSSYEVIKSSLQWKNIKQVNIERINESLPTFRPKKSSGSESAVTLITSPDGVT